MKNSFRLFFSFFCCKNNQKIKIEQGKKARKASEIFFCIFHLWYFHSIDKKHINRFNRIRCTITMQIFKYIFINYYIFIPIKICFYASS